MKYKINKLAKILGVTTNTIRRYEKMGYIVPERDESDYRWYNGNDVPRIANIRLLRKTGFTHQDIEMFLGNSRAEIKSISGKRLDEIDEEMKRLYYLRHWLKDNIQLLDTFDEMGDGFITRENRQTRYVIYSDGEKLLCEDERLKPLHGFLYQVEEVQLITLYKKSDLENDVICPHNALAIKEKDIERLEIPKEIIDSPYVEIYPQCTCVYGTVSIPADKADDLDAQKEAILRFKAKLLPYMQENNFVLDGDVAAYVVELLGSTIDYLICVPVKTSE
ncbi:MAG: MerR family transcriptional regulator [Firmicutes bacterium]|nr:MerR family transcriptional regulator [Bacillota bacterium]